MPLIHKTKNLILPKGYLSWSAISTFKRSKEEYVRHYFYGEPSEFENPYMTFGKVFAEALEKKARKHNDPIIDMVLRSLPPRGKREFEIRAILPSNAGNITLMGKLDQYDPKSHDFWEYKTGKRKWTATMAKNHGQLKFYALILWLNHGVVKQEKQLIWIETESVDGNIGPTGKIKTFPVEYKISDLLTFGKDIVKTAQEISELYQEHVNQIT